MSTKRNDLIIKNYTTGTKTRVNVLSSESFKVIKSTTDYHDMADKCHTE